MLEVKKYDGLTFEEIYSKAEILYSETNKYGEPILAIDEFLLMLDTVNGLIRTRKNLDFEALKKMRDKYASSLNEMLNDLLVLDN